jgi:hypothetical protein
MTNNNVVPRKNQEWLTLKEAAAIRKCSTKSLAILIKRHRNIINEFVRGGEKQGNKLFINQEGLLRLSNMANTNTHNSSAMYVAKSRLAGRAIKPQYDLDKLVLISQNLLASIGGLSGKIEQNKIEQDKKIADVEARLQKHEDELNKPLTPSSVQRKFLGDRVKLYAITQTMPFHTVWGAVNTHVGRGGVAFYDFADYQKAIRFIKGMYEQAGMGWD